LKFPKNDEDRKQAVGAGAGAGQCLAASGVGSLGGDDAARIP